MTKKDPGTVDKFVGSRVRMRRMMLGMSQEKLGDALGVSFQQVQKYEKGTNRVGASRLQQIASILHVPVSFFFEGAPVGAVSGAPAAKSTLPINLVAEVGATQDGLRLIIAFSKLADAKQRYALVCLVEEMAAHQDPAPKQPLRDAS